MNFKISIYSLSLMSLFACSSDSQSNNNLCLGGICLNDSIEKIQNEPWMPSNKLVLKERLGGRDAHRGFGYSKSSMDSYHKHGKNNIPSIEYTEKYNNTGHNPDKINIEKYILNITDEEKILINPYYRGRFFDGNSLNIVKKITECHGKILRGFKYIEQKSLDIVTLFPSLKTGKFEVSSIQRQFPKMEKPQSEKLLLALKSKYPSLLLPKEAEKILQEGKWSISKPMVVFNNSSNILTITKVLPSIYLETVYLKRADKLSYDMTFKNELLHLPDCINKFDTKLNLD